jgi:signal transduction histidine kinase/CheY-like chemotaxis protein
MQPGSTTHRPMRSVPQQMSGQRSSTTLRALACRVLRTRLRQVIRADRRALASGLGTIGFLCLLLMLPMLSGPFGLAHAMAVVGTLQVAAALHLSLSASAGSTRSTRRPGGRDDRRQLEEITRARDEALAADRAKSRFLAAMSHEIRTPMSGILGMSGLLLGTETTSEQRTYADAIDRSARTLLALLDEILDFSKIDAGRLTLTVGPFALDDCVQSAVELMAPRAHEKGLEIAWQIEPGVPLAVAGDSGRVRQILLNLIGNAVKFTTNGGILVRVARAPGPTHPTAHDRRLAVAISVEDTGIGVAEEDLPRLFCEFTQAERTLAGDRTGTGLGLAISRKLAQAMGGDITAESTFGLGSTFRVELMLLEQAGSAIWGARSRPPRQLVRHVLIASDRSIERRAAVATLIAEGHAATGCRSSVAATVMAEASDDGRAFDVLVVDSAAGIESATSLLQHATGLATGRHVEGMVLIDAGTRSSLADFRAAGFVGWAVRPLRPKSFARLVRRGICDDEDTPGSQASKASPQAQLLPDQRAARVLLAEDDDVNALLASCVLQKAGCLATIVRTGRAAVDAVRLGLEAGDPDFDLILMDIVMPELGGIDATRAIQALYAARDGARRIAPPIVALTANAFAEDRQTYLSAGLDDYLAKPFDAADLQALLARWSSQNTRSAA